MASFKKILSGSLAATAMFAAPMSAAETENPDASKTEKNFTVQSVKRLPAAAVKFLGSLSQKGFDATARGVDFVADKVNDKVVGPTVSQVLTSTGDLTQSVTDTAGNLVDSTLQTGENIVMDSIDAAKLVPKNPLQAARHAAGAAFKNTAGLVGNAVEAAGNLTSAAYKETGNIALNTVHNVADPVFRLGVEAASPVVFNEANTQQRMAQKMAGNVLSHSEQNAEQTAREAVNIENDLVKGNIKAFVPAAARLGSIVVNETISDTLNVLGKGAATATRVSGHIGDAAIRGDLEKMGKVAGPMLGDVADDLIKPTVEGFKEGVKDVAYVPNLGINSPEALNASFRSEIAPIVTAGVGFMATMKPVQALVEEKKTLMGTLLSLQAVETVVQASNEAVKHTSEDKSSAQAQKPSAVNVALLNQKGNSK